LQVFWGGVHRSWLCLTKSKIGDPRGLIPASRSHHSRRHQRRALSLIT
jgi:hypothetical protein